MLVFLLWPTPSPFTWPKRRIDLWAALASAVGIAAGLVINPYFPKNLSLFRQHVLMKYTGDYAVDVGIECVSIRGVGECWASARSVRGLILSGCWRLNYRDRARGSQPALFF
jgi:hypothetical protein